MGERKMHFKPKSKTKAQRGSEKWKAKAKSPLGLFVLWNKSFQDGEKYANLIFSEFRRNVNDPLSRGMNIPVYFRYEQPLLEIPCADFESTVVVALIDPAFVLSKEHKAFMKKIDFRTPGLLVIPVAIDTSAYNAIDGFTNFVRLYDKENKEEYLISIIAHETVRQLYGLPNSLNATQSNSLPPPPLKLFISHAKADGLEIASHIKGFIEKSMPLKTFFDANDISIGYDFSDEIEHNIKNSVLIVIHSDMYSSREWCRREVLLAKENNRPIVVLNCLKNGESRSFPYMANVLTVHYPSLDLNSYHDLSLWSKLITSVLKETLRLAYQRRWIEYVAERKNIKLNMDSVSSYPPELITVLKKAEKLKGEFIYPDPPLGKEEVTIIKKLNSKLKLLTPSAL